MVTIFGGMMAAQIGGALALRAHVYVRHPMMAQMRTLLDMVALVGRFLLVLLIGAWLGGILWFFGMLFMGGTLSPAKAGVSVAGSWALGLFMTLVAGVIALLLAGVLIYVLYWAFSALVGSIDSATEFTYLYPEAWWITAPGREATDDPYGLFTPWLPPDSERMKEFRSRVFGRRTKGYDE
jgi:hypothetical protein